MTVPGRVQRHRQAEADRRKVNTRGKRVSRPRQTRPQAKRPTARRPTGKRYGYAKRDAFAAMSSVFSCLCFATGSILWGAGAVASAGASSIAWRIEYKRQLAEVKATGKPIGGSAGDPVPPGVTPVELDPPQQPAPQSPARKPPAKKPAAGQPAHPGCQASAPRYCRCPGGPNRRGAKKTTTKRASTGARRTKKP